MHRPLGPTRRQAIIGASAALLASAIGQPAPLLAAEPAALRLLAGRRTLEVNGRAASVYSLAPARGQRVRRFERGARFAVTLENQLDEPTLVHWHGLTPPSAQDGTPGLSGPPLPPGARHTYDFPLTRAGTFWMHSHVGFQRAKLLAAPLIIADPQDGKRDEQEVVLFLTDFSFREPEEIFADLTGGHGAMHDMAGMDHGAMHHDMDHDAHMNHQHGGTPADMDLNDVEFDAYLANDRTLADPQVMRVEPGGRVRLRVINAAAATNFWLDLGSLSGDLVAVDGNPVAPIAGKRFELAMAQRVDVRVALPRGQGAYPVLALREGARECTGIVLATKGAKLAKLSEQRPAAAPALGVELEQRLTAARPLPRRKLDRTLAADLTGDDTMGYVWGINGKPYGEDSPFKVRPSERVEMVMRNRTTMSHPMHLHGHHFQVVAIGDRRFAGAMRDTVLVPAMDSVTIAFDADNPGRWAFHCHNEYHMAAGMMTSLEYEA